MKAAGVGSESGEISKKAKYLWRQPSSRNDLIEKYQYSVVSYESRGEAGRGK